VITLVQALCQLFAGMYGPVEALGFVNSALIIFQLCMAGIIIILFDEVLQKGQGLGTGISLFTATNIFGAIVWATLSFTSIQSPQGSLEFEGAIPFFFHSVVRWNGIYDSLFRSYGPNLFQLVNTLLITLAVNFYQNHRVELGLKSKRVREANAKLPIRLLYTSNIPVLMQCGVVMIVYFVSQMIQMFFKGSFLVSIFGSWQEAGNGVDLKPIGGLAYYLSPPDGMLQLDRFFFYVIFTLLVCAEFSRFWVDLSGQAARDLTRRLASQEMTIEDQREEQLKNYLWRYIHPASIIGGAFIGAMCVLSDIINPMASGTGIVMAICIVYQYFELIAQEKERGQDTMGFI